MTCSDFLARYSEYRDGTVTAPRERRRFERHVALCASCRAYDAALREGLAALRDRPSTITPSASFRRRLDERLAAERTALSRRRVPAVVRLAAALLLAVAVTLLASEARQRPAAAPAALPRVAFPKPVVNAGVPIVTFQDPRASVLAGNPHPYGTAFVQPASAAR